MSFASEKNPLNRTRAGHPIVVNENGQNRTTRKGPQVFVLVSICRGNLFWGYPICDPRQKFGSKLVSAKPSSRKVGASEALKPCQGDEHAAALAEFDKKYGLEPWCRN